VKSGVKAGIIVFPGTNCDRDTKRACEFFGWQTEYIWHDDTRLDQYDVIFLPGGFSYGDYVRAGGLAKFSPAVLALNEYVKSKRGFVIGICNGFQILCETGLLPGALSVNSGTRFICDIVNLKTHHNKLPQTMNLPIAHGEGRYVVPDKVENFEDLVFLKYNDNPNGSMQDIAGLYDKDSKVIGMMPHPERAVFRETGHTDGRFLFEMIEAELK
jgi:phosphoribosylformylglycinamidine synthase subunit PurQ / glutaminase